MKKKAIIAMSGGVDSSVAAYLMLQKGYDCAGATMKLYDKPQCSQPALQPCASCLISLCLSVIIYKMGIIVDPAL